MSAPAGESMDRGSDVMKSHLGGCEVMEIRQTRRGWFQECLGCEAKTEFKYFIGDTQVGHSLEEADCFCRIFCAAIHPFKMSVKEMNTDAELLEVDRPCACMAGCCKCCCYQSATITSGGQEMGSIKEQFYCCVPEYHIYDHNGVGMYKMHQPTCCGGFCVNPCTEGNPCCGKGCCKEPFHLFPYDMANTNGEEHIGKILKKPKSMMTEVFTDAETFECSFPKDCTPAQKSTIVGAAILLNAIYFEEDPAEDGE